MRRDIQIRDVSTGGEAMAIMKQQYLDGVDRRPPHSGYSRYPAGAGNSGRGESACHYRSYCIASVSYPSRRRYKLQQLQETAAIKHAQSPEQLLDLTVLLLHRANQGSQTLSATFSPRCGEATQVLWARRCS